ncbi:MAG TPA: tRNA (adenosine(37)-N6)-dimethylallyltransferase MiaA [Chloroflexota bacterium]|nr:tRNA (adenosine(37)-N6)-dimethylallyltransferase MiaA [Chloroflexota bacterium]
MPPLLVIGGPTATGKTALAVRLARAFDGEIVGADARQIYRGLDVGAGKARPSELRGVVHHLLDVATPDESFTVTQYAKLATRAILDIQRRGKLPILTGGAGLYIRAVVDGLLPPQVPPQPALRAQLEQRWQIDRDDLLRELATRDPVAAQRIDRHNSRRVIRALEVVLTTGHAFSDQQRLEPLAATTCMLALTAERPLLHRLADQRIDAMLAAGLVEEVRRLLAAGYDFSLPAFTAVGYRELAAYLGGAGDLSEVRQQMQRATHAYQRRQLTWFRADQRYHWLDVAAADVAEAALRLVAAWRDELAGQA